MFCNYREVMKDDFVLFDYLIRHNEDQQPSHTKDTQQENNLQHLVQEDDTNFEKLMLDACYSSVKMEIYQKTIQLKMDELNSLDAITLQLKDIGLEDLSECDLMQLNFNNLQLNENNLPQQLLPFINGSDDIKRYNVFLNESYKIKELSSHLEYIGYACLLYKIHIIINEEHNLVHLITLEHFSYFKVIKPFLLNALIDVYRCSYVKQYFDKLIELNLFQFSKDGSLYTNLESSKLFQIFSKRSDSLMHELKFSKLFNILKLQISEYILMHNSEYLASIFAELWKLAEEYKDKYGDDYTTIFNRYVKTRDVLGNQYCDYVKMNNCK